MKKILIGLVALVSVVLVTPQVYAAQGSCADSIERVEGLSPKVKQEMIVACETNKLAVKTPAAQVNTAEVVDNLDKYSDIALKFAKALGVAAKELGVAANEFVSTPAGLITVGFIAYSLFGATLLSVFFSMLLLVIIHNVCNGLRKFVSTDGYHELTETSKLFGTKTVKEPKKVEFEHMSEGAIAFYILSIIVELIVTIVVFVNIPF